MSTMCVCWMYGVCSAATAVLDYTDWQQQPTSFWLFELSRRNPFIFLSFLSFTSSPADGIQLIGSNFIFVYVCVRTLVDVIISLSTKMTKRRNEENIWFLRKLYSVYRYINVWYGRMFISFLWQCETITHKTTCDCDSIVSNEFGFAIRVQSQRFHISERSVSHVSNSMDSISITFECFLCFVRIVSIASKFAVACCVRTASIGIAACCCCCCCFGVKQLMWSISLTITCVDVSGIFHVTNERWNACMWTESFRNFPFSSFSQKMPVTVINALRAWMQNGLMFYERKSKFQNSNRSGTYVGIGQVDAEWWIIVNGIGKCWKDQYDFLVALE